MTATLAPPMFLYFPNPNNSGSPSNGFKLFTYLAGSSTKQVTWTDSTQNTQNANPLLLDANGVAAASSAGGIWGDPSLSYKFVWAPANDTDPPSSPIRTVDNIQFPLTQPLLFAILGYAKTSAEITSGVTPVNLGYPPGHLYRYVTNTIPGTTDCTSGFIAILGQYQAGGAEGYVPETTAVLSNLTINVMGFRMRSAGYGSIIQQKPGSGSIAIITIQASKVDLDPLSFVGNINTDTLEFNHCISIAPTSPISDITIRGAYGTNIRGDIVNISATSTNTVNNVKVGIVDGLNIYRNTFSNTGGAGVEVDSVLGSQVGYRNVDVEPNASSQTPDNTHFHYIRGANVQFSGANLSGGIGRVLIDHLDLDNSLLANSSPGYTGGAGFPGAPGNIGIIAGNFQSLKIGSLKARNYQERVFVSSANTFRTYTSIEDVDISNCDNTEVTYNTLFYCDANAVVEVNGGVVTLAAIGRTICNSSSASTFRLKNLKISGGCIAANGVNCEFENLTYDATGVTGNVFAAVNKSQFRNVVVTNDGSATLQNLCSDNVWQNSSAAPSALNTAGGTHVYLKCVFNSVAYRLNGLEGVVAFNPGTVAAGATAQTTITVTGAAIGDYCTGVSFAGIPTGYATVTWQGNVTAANTVTVTYHNTGGAGVTFANDTLRAVVQKAT